MWTEEHPVDDGITAIVFFRPKIINQEDLIDRIEFKGFNSGRLQPVNWSASPRTRQQANDELNITIFR